MVVVPVAVLRFVVFKVHCSKCLRKPQDQDWSTTQRPTHLASHPQTSSHPSVVDQPWARGFSLAASFSELSSHRNRMEWNEMLLKLNCLRFFFVFSSIFYSFTGRGRGCDAFGPQVFKCFENMSGISVNSGTKMLWDKSIVYRWQIIILNWKMLDDVEYLIRPMILTHNSNI